MGREGCIDLDPMWPGDDGRPRGPTLCVMYPRCECGMADAKTRHATAAYWFARGLRALAGIEPIRTTRRN